MGAETSSHSENGGGGGGTTANNETQVVLNVYDLTPLNKYTVWFGFGIFHSGIEGKDYLFLLIFDFDPIRERHKKDVNWILIELLGKFPGFSVFTTMVLFRVVIIVHGFLDLDLFP